MPGDRGPYFLHAARERGPLDELTGVPFAPLRSRSLHASQIVPPVTRDPRAWERAAVVIFAGMAGLTVLRKGWAPVRGETLGL